MPITNTRNVFLDSWIKFQTLLLYLYEETRYHFAEAAGNEYKQSGILRACASGMFELAPDVPLHMYVSEPPCGEGPLLLVEGLVLS